MPAFGYKRSVVDPNYGLLELREVSFDLSPADLRRVAAFLRACADRAEGSEPHSNHVHIEEIDRGWRKDHMDLDVIVILGKYT